MSELRELEVTCEICGEKPRMCECRSKMTPLKELLRKARDDERDPKVPSPEVKL